MLIIDGAQALAAALARPLDPHLARLLALRRDQLGDDIEDAARFIVVEPPDTIAAVETALGFPLLLDGMPAWEWSEQRDGGLMEVVFTFGDTADVLLVPNRDDFDPALTSMLRQHGTFTDDRLQPQVP